MGLDTEYPPSQEGTSRMRSEQEIKALLMQARRYALQNPSSRAGLWAALILDTTLRWVLEEVSMGELAYIISGGTMGDPENKEDV